MKQQKTITFYLWRHDANNELISLKNTEKGVRLKESIKFDSYF